MTNVIKLPKKAAVTQLPHSIFVGLHTEFTLGRLHQAHCPVNVLSFFRIAFLRAS